MGSRRAFVGVGCALVASAAIVAACETFDEAPAADGGADGSTSSDGPVSDVTAAGDASNDATADGSSGGCEVLLGTTFATAGSAVTALAADGAHVYWGTTQGLSRQGSGGGNVDTIENGLGTCTDIVLGGDFLAARFGNGPIRVESKMNIGADATVPNISPTSAGLYPQASTKFFARRDSTAYTCPSTSPSCSQILAQSNVSALAAGGSGGGFDYMAASGSSAGVFHCPSSCNVPDSGILLAAASQNSTKLTGDETFVYFLDRTAGALRKVPRAGGVTSDIITGLLEPIDVEIDSTGRFVIATLVNGVFRGPPSGCVAPPTTAGATIGGLAVSGTTVWYAEGADIKRVGP